jgi:hypothetical protein
MELHTQLSRDQLKALLLSTASMATSRLTARSGPWQNKWQPSKLPEVSYPVPTWAPTRRPFFAGPLELEISAPSRVLAIAR